MTDELPVPFELMEFSLCGCKTNRNAMRWKCIKYQLIGTDLYTFVSGKNDGTYFDTAVHDNSIEDQF